ncbi:hypothetical protein [Candidatus Nitrosotalea okcheonensis]|uniref:Uncharacterized protein n=1 Tax=Candidatus Nitrosotalea okcheonensis TaxID=1903276 RepID=A0A2H1FHF5_9ARCH|nr:hypothetical protein [Candidatus Nitrosotalea okcheonensis]SMH72199.1 protein of unknown function [Candidatus Nitrosotalea okcheonensis]
MKKISISLTPELHSAIIRAAMDNDVKVSRIISEYLKEHPMIKKYVEEIRAEPDAGVFAVNPKQIHSKSKNEITVSS